MTVLCNKCTSPANFTCHRCDTCYCSKSCQVQDWPAHKYICYPMPPLVPIISDAKIATKPQESGDSNNNLIKVAPSCVKAPSNLLPACADLLNQLRIPDVFDVPPPPLYSPPEPNVNDFKKYRATLQRGTPAGNCEKEIEAAKACEKVIDVEKEGIELVNSGMKTMSLKSSVMKSETVVVQPNIAKLEVAPAKPAPEVTTTFTYKPPAVSSNVSIDSPSTTSAVKKLHLPMVMNKRVEPAPKQYTFDEFLGRDLFIGKNQKIMCVDRSHIMKAGQFYGFSVERNAGPILDELNLNINAFCKKESSIKEYRPKFQEVCLSLFPEDDVWYRTACISMEGDVFEMFFVDYGNVCKINKEFIRPITEEFMKIPVYTHLITIFGFPKNVTQDVIDRVNTYFDETQDVVNLDIEVDESESYIARSDKLFG